MDVGGALTPDWKGERNLIAEAGKFCENTRSVVGALESGELENGISTVGGNTLTRRRGMPSGFL